MSTFARLNSILDFSSYEFSEPIFMVKALRPQKSFNPARKQSFIEGPRHFLPLSRVSGSFKF